MTSSELHADANMQYFPPSTGRRKDAVACNNGGGPMNRQAAVNDASVDAHIQIINNQ
jgi:hypothetical protein